MVELKISLSGAISLSRLNEKTQANARMNGATAIKNLIRDNFVKRGGHSFWAEAANATRVKQEGNDVAVWVEHTGVHLRWKGGTVLPGKNKSSHTGEDTKLLSLPADKKTKHSSPIFHSPLFFLSLKKRGHLKALLIEGKEIIAEKKYKDKPAGRVILSGSETDSRNKGRNRCFVRGIIGEIDWMMGNLYTILYQLRHSFALNTK